MGEIGERGAVWEGCDSVVEDVDDNVGLAFLEVEPVERLFEFILDEELCGKSFRSVLFGRAALVEFGSWADCGGPSWALISSNDPKCAKIEIGYTLDGGFGTTYFATAKNTCITDDDVLFGLSDEDKKNALLEYLQCAIEYGYVEYVGDLSGPLRAQDVSSNWFSQWKTGENKARDRYASEPSALTMRTVLFFVILSPLLVPLTIYALIRFVVVRGFSRPRRYPAFPVE